QGGAGQAGGTAAGQVVAVEADVQLADGHGDAFELPDGGGDRLRQGHPPGVDPYENDPVGAVVALDDLVGESVEAAPHVVDAQSQVDGCLHPAPCRPLGTGLIGGGVGCSVPVGPGG